MNNEKLNSQPTQSATGSEIADWIQKIFGVNRASAELAANRYLTGTMAPCLLLNGLEQAFPNERGML